MKQEDGDQVGHQMLTRTLPLDDLKHERIYVFKIEQTTLHWSPDGEPGNVIRTGTENTKHLSTSGELLVTRRSAS